MSCELSQHSLLQPVTDFKLCVICQKPGGNLRANPQPDCYVKFLEAVKRRAELSDGDYPAMNRRLS